MLQIEVIRFKLSISIWIIKAYITLKWLYLKVVRECNVYKLFHGGWNDLVVYEIDTLVKLIITKLKYYEDIRYPTDSSNITTNIN